MCRWCDLAPEKVSVRQRVSEVPTKRDRETVDRQDLGTPVLQVKKKKCIQARTSMEMSF